MTQSHVAYLYQIHFSNNIKVADMSNANNTFNVVDSDLSTVEIQENDSKRNVAKDGAPNRLVNLTVIQDVVNTHLRKCVACGTNSLHLKKDDSLGVASYLTIGCMMCDKKEAVCVHNGKYLN